MLQSKVSFCFENLYKNKGIRSLSSLEAAVIIIIIFFFSEAAYKICERILSVGKVNFTTKCGFDTCISLEKGLKRKLCIKCKPLNVRPLTDA